LNLVSNIELSEIDLKNQNLIKKYFPNTKNILNLKDHRININYKNNILSLKGLGKIKLQDKFDFIDYEVVNKGSDLDLVSNIELSEIDLKNQNLIKKYFPNTKNILNLKDHRININYKNNILSLKGLGKVKLENEFNKNRICIFKEK
jgi:spermidine synthase